MSQPHDGVFNRFEARTRRRTGLDRSCRSLSSDYNVRPCPARIWLQPRAIGLYREIWWLAAVGGDGLLSGRDGRVSSATAERRIHLGVDRGCRRAVSARACSLARCLSADIARRAVARSHLLALEYARLWR